MSPDESFILGEWLSWAVLGESLQHIAPAFSRARFDKTG